MQVVYQLYSRTILHLGAGASANWAHQSEAGLRQGFDADNRQKDKPSQQKPSQHPGATSDQQCFQKQRSRSCILAHILQSNRTDVAEM